MPKPPQIFISYAREDYRVVRKLYDRLKAAGYKPWMDKVDLLAGAAFDKAIPKVLRESDLFIVCLSSNSVNKRSFIQREINLALDILEEKLGDDLYIFPVRLDECVAPDRIAKFNWTDLFGDDHEEEWEKLLRSLQYQAERLGLEMLSIKEIPAPKSTHFEPIVVPEPEQKATPTLQTSRPQPYIAPRYLNEPELPIRRKPAPPISLSTTKKQNTKVAGINPLWFVALVVGVIGMLSWVAISRNSSISDSTNSAPKVNSSPVKSNSPTEKIKSEAPSFTENLNGVPLEMIRVPAGTFTMGGNGGDDEKPSHPVNVPSFYIGKYEVTQKQWQIVMGNNPSHFKGDDLPVESVSWNDAKEFCKKLTEMTGQTYRLPSEAEWEYACRAGTMGDYAGKLDEMAWYRKNSVIKTHPVGQKKLNAFGLYDMHGNVWEWCEDVWHDNYNNAPKDGSAWTDSAKQGDRVLRGGS